MLAQFGPHSIDPSHVFFKSHFVLGLVNIKPIVPGHVLVISRRIVKRVADLTNEEAADLFCSSRLIGKVLEQKYNALSLTFSVQDGEFAGQTVPHVHMHIIPRYPNDFQPNDLIYNIIEGKAKPNVYTSSLGKLDTSLSPNRELTFVSSQKELCDVENNRAIPRSAEEMASEASWLATFFANK